MTRIERISAILIQLQSKSVITAQEIADRFGISVRTVYRDIRTLEESGVPIASEAGIGYSLADGYKLPPVQFTPEEAVAFITAEKLIEKLTDQGLNTDFQSGITKIKSILRPKEKLYLESLENQIAVVENHFVPRTNDDEKFLPRIIRSIANKNLVQISYIGGHNPALTQRTLEPVGIFFQSPRWHFIAYCHLREDYRQFRIDRIQNMSVLQDHFEGKHPPLEMFINKLAQERELSKVVLDIENSVVSFLGDQLYYHGYVSSERGDIYTRFHFLTPSLEGMARWFMMMGDHCKIVEPEILQSRVKEIFNKIEKNL